MFKLLLPICEQSGTSTKFFPNFKYNLFIFLVNSFPLSPFLNFHFSYLIKYLSDRKDFKNFSALGRVKFALVCTQAPALYDQLYDQRSSHGIFLSSV